MTKQGLLTALIALLCSIGLVGRESGINSAEKAIFPFSDQSEIIYNGNFEKNIAQFEHSENWKPSANAKGEMIEISGNNGDYNLISPLITLPTEGIGSTKTLYLTFEDSAISGEAIGEIFLHTSKGKKLLDVRTEKNNGIFSADISDYAGETVKVEYNLKANGSKANWKIKNMRLLYERTLQGYITSMRTRYNEERNNQFVYLDVVVSGDCPKIDKFTKENFEIRENDIIQDIYMFEQPTAKHYITSADIVFVVDVTSSMTDVIDAMKVNMVKLLDTLEESGIKYRVGFVVFGNRVSVLNYGELYEERSRILYYTDQISINYKGMSSGSEPEENCYGAIMSATEMNFSPAAKKIIIPITDASSFVNDSNQTPKAPTKDFLLQRLHDKNIVCYPIFNLYNQTQREQYIDLSQETTVSGKFYHIGTDFSIIMEELLNEITNTYRIVYKSKNTSQTKYDRNVQVKVSYDSIVK